MKVVNQLCDKVPGASVMLLSPQTSGQVFCACQVSKVRWILPALHLHLTAHFFLRVTESRKVELE